MTTIGSGPDAAARADAAPRADRANGEPKRVVVTRSEASDGPLSSELRNLGLPVLLWPAVSVELTEPGPLEEALAHITSFQWIVFASRHAVAAVTALRATPPAGVKIAAVGQATAQVLRQRGWPVDLLPSESNSAALVDAFAAEGGLGAAPRTNARAHIGGDVRASTRSGAGAAPHAEPPPAPASSIPPAPALYPQSQPA